MRAMAVVVRHVGPEHPVQVPAPEDQHPVKTLRSDGADPALGEGVRIRRSDRAEDHRCPFRAEDLVEGAGELRVPVVGQEPNGRRAAVAVDGQVPRLLGDPGRVGMGRRGRDEDAPRLQLDEHQDVDGLEPDRLHAEEVASDDPLRLGLQELRPGGSGSPGAGPRPAFLRSIRIVVAPTRMPNLRSSPWIRTAPRRGSLGRDAGSVHGPRGRSEVSVGSPYVRTSTSAAPARGAIAGSSAGSR